MTFEAGAWVAGTLGLLGGLAASRLSTTPLSGTAGLLDGVMGGIGGVVLALLLYGLLSLLEGWAAFFQRPASPLVPLLITAAMLVGWVTALWVVRRRRGF